MCLCVRLGVGDDGDEDPDGGEEESELDFSSRS